jgi:hypothetical protein
MKAIALQSVVYKEGKYFVAQCLDVDVSSFGDSEKEALDLYFEDTPVNKINTVNNPSIHTLRVQYV